MGYFLSQLLDQFHDATRFDQNDPKVLELQEKVGSLVDRDFGGDFEKAFHHFDRNKDQGIGRNELNRLLKDARIGNVFTRPIWIDGIIDTMDNDHDGKIQWREFADLLHEPSEN